ncbi:MAG: prephenate dehydrogenase/arogenate dehydrogenase family protein [Dehalococcoidia bacterium]
MMGNNDKNKDKDAPKMVRIAIIGLGLIGGSLGMAVRRALKDVQVAGFSRTVTTARKAKSAGAIDIDAPTAADAVRDARLVVLAAPVMTFPAILEEIAPALMPGAVVTDVGSTKAQVARWAQQILPDTVAFVGGHPMAGKEQSGIDAADPELFRGKPWAIAPGSHAPEAAVRTVISLAQLVGAEPLFVDAEEHDSYVAAISHLPLLVATALFSTANGSAAWPELAQLASSGFRDTTRLASGSPQMAHDIMASNRDNALHWLDRFTADLARLRALIADDDTKPLLEAFARAELERDNFMINGPPRREMERAPIEKIGISDMLLGSRLADLMRGGEQTLRRMEGPDTGRKK